MTPTKFELKNSKQKENILYIICTDVLEFLVAKSNICFNFLSNLC